MGKHSRIEWTHHTFNPCWGCVRLSAAFVSGAPFFARDPDLSTLRLSFATADVPKIEEGIGRLGQAL